MRRSIIWGIGPGLLLMSACGSATTPTSSSRAAHTEAQVPAAALSPTPTLTFATTPAPQPTVVTQAPTATGTTDDVANTAPDFVVDTLEGTPFHLAARRGKVAILLFTAGTTIRFCSACLRESDTLAKVHETYAERGVEILIISVDPLATEADLKPVRELADHADHLYVALDAAQAITHAYNAKALETTIIIDRTGHIVYRDLVTTSYDTYARELQQALAASE